MNPQLPYLIAEIGFNHEGCMETAQKMIEAAARAGAHAVKFQTFRAHDIALPSSPHYCAIQQGEMDLNQHLGLARAAANAGIEFLSTPFSLWAVDLLESVGVKAYKVASMDCANHRLLKTIAQTGKPIYLATGMASVEEIAASIQCLKTNQSGPVTLLHCIAKYPAEARDLHLSIIPWLKERFGLPAGYSDHFPGPKACLVAALMGAEVIETHFTLDNTRQGGDHFHSVTPTQLENLIQQMRDFLPMRGNGSALNNRPDREMAKDFRRGLYAAQNLPAGHILSESDVLQTRPRSDFSPNDLGSIVGKTLKMEIPAYAPLNRDAIQEAE